MEPRLIDAEIGSTAGDAMPIDCPSMEPRLIDAEIVR